MLELCADTRNFEAFMRGEMPPYSIKFQDGFLRKFVHTYLSKSYGGFDKVCTEDGMPCKAVDLLRVGTFHLTKSAKAEWEKEVVQALSVFFHPDEIRKEILSA